MEVVVDSVGDEKTVRLFGHEIPRSMFVIRLFYLLYFASFGSLFPLLGVYFKQLGMTAGQAGLLLGCRPLVEFIAVRFWSTFADRFRKVKLLLLFSLASLCVFTLAIGFVQPPTPFCVVLDRNNSGGECKLLVPAGEIIRGGALGFLKEAAGVGKRRRRETSNAIIATIIDLSSYDSEDDRVIGKAPEFITSEKVCNYNQKLHGVLISPPHSTRVYREPAVEQSFMLLLLLVALGELFSSPAIALADGYTLTVLAEKTKEFGKVRLFGSVGWAIAMLIMGIGLDYSDTFRNHPCPTTNTSEKNYTLCFVACTILALAAMAVATQFKFSSTQEQHRADEIGGLVMDTRMAEVDPAIAQKARGKQLRAAAATEEALWKASLKSMVNVHFVLYLLAVVTTGFGAGNVFAFLYWSLQDLGGSPILFGLCSVTNHAAEIAAYFYTFQIINKYGYIKTMYACLGANVIRFLLIAWISNPWLILPLQALQGVTLSVVWASATSYVSLVSPSHLKSHNQYILALLYNGVGKGLGPILGGMFISSSGSRALFALIALLNLSALGANFVVNRVLKYDGIKYSNQFEDEDGDAIGAPQGMPMAPQDPSKITDAFNNANTAMNANYGTIEESNPQDDAYDRYVSSNPFK
ncbi:MFS domain-containing protein [Aphelenchoides fujianensis]|nr:MFS domain-containing protein [Aphelenchoides fujianensis]